MTKADLTARLLERIARGAHAPLPDAEFDALAREVFAHQFAQNRAYRAYCERRGATPGRVERWSEVPAVPTDAFKAAPLVTGDPADAVAVFRTSGTTRGVEARGTHYFPSLALYDAALLAGFRAHLLPDAGRIRILSLVPRPADAPDSSLSHMVGEVVAALGAGGSGWYLDAEGGVDGQGLAGALHRAADDEAPVALLGTTFALVHWLDALTAAGAAFTLPQGSRVMDTGGSKGRAREVSRGELHAAFRERLGIESAWCVNEYGMTELSSQFYDGVAGSAVAAEARVHSGPGWVRTAAADPESLRVLPHGAVGVLRHFDLANLGSVAAVQTADLGVTFEGGFRVLGRARGAEARGCSLAMEELLRAVGRG